MEAKPPTNPAPCSNRTLVPSTRLVSASESVFSRSSLISSSTLAQWKLAMIIDKQPLPDDPTPTDAPPSYDTVGSNSGSVRFHDSKVFVEPVITASTSKTHIHPSGSVSPTPIAKSPSASSAKGKGRANNWFNFTASRTTREVQATVLGLIRDLVKEQNHNSRASLGILESCAEACSGYDLSLSTLLQENSIEGHTPMYWAIVKRPPDGEEGESAIPDLLTALISYASPVTPKTIDDIRHACLLTSDQLLFQRLRMSPEFSPLSGTDEMLLGATIPPDEITVENVPGDEGAFAVDFQIVHFQKRMLVSKRIELDFIARARMWRLEFSIVQAAQYKGPRQGSWCISLSLLEHSPPTWIDSRLIIPEPISHSADSPSSPSLLDRVRARPKPKQTIVMRLKSQAQLVAPPNKQCTAIVVSLEDNMAGSSLQYAGTSYIAPDETLRARLEARLGRATADSDCTIC
ncbi:hypothetical protein D9615_008916 [Tricholomella constricta]|uniref:Uncharacterized protein n=1 Tax=Tricholomella constricta TaxID=117010 RepID=A0A8H5LZ20_9AGAR|nr:hypothetical protein D9615_008916 [Tricholomella constricta]